MAEKQSVKCPVCIEMRTELKTLPCQHSFCQHCLKDWLEKKGTLECPNCRQVHSISQSELQELPSYAEKIIEQQEEVPKSSIPKCCCGECDADFYCQECSQYLCKACKKSHEMFPALKNHQLQELDCFEECNQSLCQVHEKELDFFCNTCKIPICSKCKDTDHQNDDGEHEPIKIIDAFEEFKETATALMQQANIYTQQIQVGISKCTANASNLNSSQIRIKKDVISTVEEIIKLAKESGKVLEEKLKEVCDLKNETINSQIGELIAMSSAVKEKQNVITKLVKGGAAKALQSGQEVIAKLQEMLDDVPETEPRDDGKVYYIVKKDHVLSALQEHGIGVVTEKPNANIFEILSENPLDISKSNFCRIKLAKNAKYEIDMGLMSATWNYINTSGQPELAKRMVTHIRGVEYNVELPANIGNYPTIKHTLDIQYVDNSIKRSPLNVYFHNCGSVRTIYPYFTADVNIDINSLLLSKNDYFFVSGTNNIIGKFNSSSGAYLSKITLMPEASCCGMCELNNNDLVFCDAHNKKITLCNPNGRVYKSLSTGLESESNPLGFDVNESLDLVYVAESGYVNVFDMTSGDKVKTIGTMGYLEGQMVNPSSVAVTKDGNIIVADTDNSRVQLFDKEGIFKCILIGGGFNNGLVISPSQVIVDNADNIIVASPGKVQLFDSNGKFIKIIYQDNRNPPTLKYVTSIFSHNPQSIAVAVMNSRQISIINY